MPLLWVPPDNASTKCSEGKNLSPREKGKVSVAVVKYQKKNKHEKKNM
jgi:hypothetical protein